MHVIDAYGNLPGMNIIVPIVNVYVGFGIDAVVDQVNIDHPADPDADHASILSVAPKVDASPVRIECSRKYISAEWRNLYSLRFKDKWEADDCCK